MKNGQLGGALPRRRTRANGSGDRNDAMTDLAPANAAQVASSAYRLRRARSRLPARRFDPRCAISARISESPGSAAPLTAWFRPWSFSARRAFARTAPAGRASGTPRRARSGGSPRWKAARRGAGRRSANVVATGGGPGTMEAANRGAFEAGAPTIGFNITLPREQEPNRFTTPALTFRFHYFAMRKMHFAMGAKALVVFPGGFGTFDELFELRDAGADGQGAGDADRARRRGLLAQGGRLGGAGRRPA